MLSPGLEDRAGSDSEGPELREAFVGSTVYDLDDYRKQVQDVLLRRAEVASFLSEDWQGGYDDTVQKCKDRVMRAGAYFGVFAHYYGSIPPGSDLSITHMEFKWAKEKWGSHPYPFLAVFRPEPSSEADEELKEKALELLLEKEDAYKQQHPLRLEAFIEEVLNPHERWRTSYTFIDKYDLRERVLTTCLTWKGTLPKAAREPASSSRIVQDEELGQLGRTEHLDAIIDALSEADSRPEVPAVALLLHGTEDAGQKECCAFLLGDDQLRPRSRGGVLQMGRPSSHYYDRQLLIQWAGQCIRRNAYREPIETLDDLAACIHDALERDRVTLFLDQVERYPGGVAGFQQTFWQPLYEKLEVLRAERPSPHRLIFGVVAYQTGENAWGAACCDADEEAADIAYTQLLKVPELTPFDKRDVRRWLREMDIPDQPPGRRNQLVDIALKNPEGDADGTPRRVFERLRNEYLWPDENA